MDLYSKISRLVFTKDEKAALRAYFTKNPIQEEKAAIILPTCEDDSEKVQYLQNLLKPEA
ncbi:12669_t:CDS:1, partial [Funneliformis mosseae]